MCLPSCLSDYCQVALTSAVMKFFERLVKNDICTSLPSSFDPLQFAYKASRSRVDAISNLQHTGLISENNEQAYQNQVTDLALWCQSNNLPLNVYKTKGMVVDFRQKQDSGYTPLSISGEPVERVPRFKYLGVHLTEDLTWTLHTQHLTKSSRQRLFFLGG